MVDGKGGLRSIYGLLWAAFLLVVVPNFLFWIIADSLSLGRPLINVDYAFAAIFLAFQQRAITAVSIFASFFFDFLALLGQIFPVLHFSDIIYVSGFVGMAPPFYQGAVFLGFFMSLTVAWFASGLRKRASLVNILIVINVMVFLYIFQVFSGESRDDRVWRVADGRLIDSQIIFGIDSRNNAFINSFDSEEKVFSDVKIRGATDSWFSGEDPVEDRVLLIVSESWGVSDDAITEAILSPIYKNSRVGNLRNGTIDFKGLTIAAEMRELCQLYPNNFNFSQSDGSLSRCLPNKLKERGYATFAMHGAAGLMYDRVQWYPKVGFDHLTFFESYSWDRRCYSFPGACDSELMRHLKFSFDRVGKVFSYWLTLNSHSRYDSRDIQIDVFDCGDYDVLPDSQTCRNLKLHAQFFYNLANLLDEPYMEDVEVLIVGDHEPPILNSEEKDRYFTRNTVPWLHFDVGSDDGLAARQ